MFSFYWNYGSRLIMSKTFRTLMEICFQFLVSVSHDAVRCRAEGGEASNPYLSGNLNYAAVFIMSYTYFNPRSFPKSVPSRVGDWFRADSLTETVTETDGGGFSLVLSFSGSLSIIFGRLSMRMCCYFQTMTAYSVTHCLGEEFSNWSCV